MPPRTRLKREHPESASDAEEHEDPESASDAEEPAAPARNFFASGTVKKIRVHDFMTYNGTVTISPGPRLNLVLGPNGTGKSSFVCALCIGLNGSIKTLGRGDDIKAFVRTGMREFWSEVTLSSGGNGRDRVVRRTVTTRGATNEAGDAVTRYESKWRLDGADCTSKDVDRLVHGLNIQFDNLCQFLPQDKVAEFARLDSYELLAATEKALGDASLYEQHQELIGLRNSEKSEAGERESNVTRMAKLKVEQERQQRDYERFQQREQLLKEAGTLRRLAKWREVDIKGRAAEAAKKRVAERTAELQELEQQQEEDTRPAREREAVLKRVQEAKAAAIREGRGTDTQMRSHRDAVERLVRELDSLAQELISLEEQSRKRLAEIGSARQRLAAAEAGVQGIPEHPPPALQERMNELWRQMEENTAAINALEQQRNGLALQEQGVHVRIARVEGDLEVLESRRHQLMRKLEGRCRNLGALWQWLEQHRADGTFEGPVFGPVALELAVSGATGVSDAQAQQYVENTCWAWLSAFVVTTKADEKRLSDECRRLQVWDVKVACSVHDPNQQYDMQYPAGTARERSRYGILHTLDELVEAPPIILHALVVQSSINSVFIGNDHAAANMTALASETPINTVLVGASRLSVLRSRYSKGSKAIEEKELYPSRLLDGSGGAEEEAAKETYRDELKGLAQERDALRARREELGSQAKELDRQNRVWDAEFAQQQAQLEAIKLRRRQLLGAVEGAKRQLRTAEAVADPESRRPQLRQAIQAKTAMHMDRCQQLLAALQAVWAGMQKANVLELRFREVKAQLEMLNANRNRREQALQAARTALAEAKASFQAAKADWGRAKEGANEDYPMEEADREELERLSAAGTQPHALERQAEAKEAEAEKAVCSNQNVANEFTRRQAQIAECGRVVAEKDAELQRLRARIEEVKGEWLPEIQAMVETINASFSHNFKEIGYAGEVRLHEEEDFDKFAIEILVQFRASEGMQLLTQHRQSGGEKSTSTVLYLIALQGVTSTPFRVVDEINQGMDSNNERKVFRLLVAASTEAHTPQCFLVTPKLLPGLEYTRDIRVLHIMNGPSITDELPGKFNLGDGLYGSRFRNVRARH